jgi:hypothetical protein
MKKLVFTICGISILLLAAYNSISTGSKTIAKSANRLSVNKMNDVDPDTKGTSADNKSGGVLLPLNTWNAKMMIW